MEEMYNKVWGAGAQSIPALSGMPPSLQEEEFSNPEALWTLLFKSFYNPISCPKKMGGGLEVPILSSQFSLSGDQPLIPEAI